MFVDPFKYLSYVLNWYYCRLHFLQLSYAIGIAEPLAINVNSYGTAKISDKKLLDIIVNNFDLRPGVIVK